MSTKSNENPARTTNGFTKMHPKHPQMISKTLKKNIFGTPTNPSYDIFFVYFVHHHKFHHIIKRVKHCRKLQKNYNTVFIFMIYLMYWS